MGYLRWWNSDFAKVGRREECLRVIIRCVCIWWCLSLGKMVEEWEEPPLVAHFLSTKIYFNKLCKVNSLLATMFDARQSINSVR